MDGISFFIPAYNCENTVEESIESILDSNFDSEKDELIIVNDCSTDGTLALLNQIKEKYKHIIVLSNTRNRGGAATRNIAIEKSTKDLVFCLDSDNVLEKGSITKLKAKLKKENADIAVFEELHFFKTTTKEITHKWNFDLVTWDAGYLLSHSKNPPASGNYLFTKASWIKAEGYPEFARALDTWGFGVRQLFTGSKMVICENSYYFHRHGHDSYWMREGRLGKTSLTALQVLIPFFDFIHDDSINHIMGKKFRYNWLENIDKYPLQILKEKKKILNDINRLNSGKLSKIKQKLIHLFSS